MRGRKSVMSIPGLRPLGGCITGREVQVITRTQRHHIDATLWPPFHFNGPPADTALLQHVWHSHGHRARSENAKPVVIGASCRFETVPNHAQWEGVLTGGDGGLHDHRLKIPTWTSFRFACIQSVSSESAVQSFSSDLGLVSSSRVSLHVCLAAFSSAPADFPLKRSRCGRK